MRELGSVNQKPQNVAPQNFEQRANVAVHRTEKPAERESVTVSRTPVVETQREVQSRGAQEQVVDSRHHVLYSRPAASFHETTNVSSQSLVYTQQANTVSTSVEQESKPLLDLRV